MTRVVPPWDWNDRILRAIKEGKRAVDQLRTEYVAWLGSVAPSGTREQRDRNFNLAVETLSDSPRNRATEQWSRQTANIRANLRRYDIDFEVIDAKLLWWLWGYTHRSKAEFVASSTTVIIDILETRLRKLCLKPPPLARSLRPVSDAEESAWLKELRCHVSAEGRLLAMSSHPAFVVAESPHPGFEREDARHFALLERIKANRERVACLQSRPKPLVYRPTSVKPDSAIERIVENKTRKFKSKYPHLDEDDIRQHAHCEALKKPPSKKPEFAGRDLEKLLDQRLANYCMKESRWFKSSHPLPHAETEDADATENDEGWESPPKSFAQTAHPRPDKEPFDVSLLTPQERDMWLLAREGSTQEQIATRLGIGQYTVSRTLSRIEQKLGG
jgi:DNA-binding CsgD family transcriptional regulator